MNDTNLEAIKAIAEASQKPNYEAPVVRIMSEAEVLAAFQVNATSSTMGWWAC